MNFFVGLKCRFENIVETLFKKYVTPKVVPLEKRETSLYKK